jgi:hypothetical protein
VTHSGGTHPLEEPEATGRPRRAEVRLERDVQSSMGMPWGVNYPDTGGFQAPGPVAGQESLDVNQELPAEGRRA